jgi:hypothetical protein
MNPDEQSRELKHWLLNPFIYVAGEKALGIGVAAVLTAGLIGYFSRTHFDGVLDVHTGSPAPLWLFLSEGVVDWLCLSVVLWVLGMIVSKTSFRALDLFGTQALARWPTLLISVIALIPSYTRFLEQLTRQLLNPGAGADLHPTDAVFGSVILLLMVLLIVWMVLLAYKSYAISCNLAGGKAIVSFIGGLILAEIASKVAIVLLAGSLMSGAMGYGRPAATPEKESKVSAGVEAATEWLERVDRKEYGESWEHSASFFREHISRDDWITTIASARQPFGKLLAREVGTTRYTTDLPGAPKGEYVIIQFNSSFEEKKGCVETVTPMLDVDGMWRVSGYYIR